MSLNALAGAGQTKRALLESKGIYEERATGEVQILGGIFNRKRISGSGSSTPKTEKVNASSVIQRTQEVESKEPGTTMKDKKARG